MKEKPLTNLRLPDLWKEFNSNFNESFWEEFEQKMKLMKKKFIELALQEEITALTGAQKYERTPERVYRRNGYWKRYIILKDGKLQINMPRLRETGFQSIYLHKNAWCPCIQCSNQSHCPKVLMCL
ncbi:transposase, Mutator family [Thermodesulfovibrio aggregans]|uniref:Transposase, Mutator family n=1 Tax=Thermodesulfovibrio aggregans TaxID=86166 RepID=A0A0U9HRW3_9BACT|nr:transposase [Thermodesulfovibrio aggregans]GAQ95779.1 transposase, Mutator family [Thermodesulfovibrio aggregans]